MRTSRLSLAWAVVLLLLGGLAGGVIARDGEAPAQGDAASQPAIPSAGCGQSDVAPGKHTASTEVNGGDYSWVTWVPTAHDGVTPLPLWMQLHGCCGETGFDAVNLLSEEAEEHGFVVAGPQAAVGAAGWAWRDGDTELDASMSNPDIAFLDGLLDRLGDEYCLDLARVYVGGFSGGGEGVSVLTCFLEDRVAAVAPVSGLFDPGAACGGLDRPVPVLAVHGTSDEVVPFDGGFGDWGRPELPTVADASIPERVEAMALRNGCGSGPTTAVLDIDVEAWADPVEMWTWDCPQGAEVELMVHGGSHGWPSAGGQGFDGTGLIWEFFEQHPMLE